MKQPMNFVIEGKELLSGYLTTQFNRLWKQERVLDEWQDVNMIMIHKGGSKYVLNEYRGIAISSNVGYCFANIIRERLEDNDRDLKGPAWIQEGVQMYGWIISFDTFD